MRRPGPSTVEGSGSNSESASPLTLSSMLQPVMQHRDATVKKAGVERMRSGKYRTLPYPAPVARRPAPAPRVNAATIALESRRLPGRSLGWANARGAKRQAHGMFGGSVAQQRKPRSALANVGTPSTNENPQRVASP